MDLFSEDAGVAYLKMGIYGPGGSGKTWTATDVAIGLAKYIRASGHPPPRILFVDSEKGAHWVAPLVRAAGLQFGVLSTRAFIKLVQAMDQANKEHCILIIDSITHFWQEVQKAYLESQKAYGRKKNRLEFQDFGVIKPMWEEFTAKFVNAEAHVILCGRAANIYDYQENDQGKKELITVGTRLGAEKGTSYEPSLNVEMHIEHVQAARGSKKKRIENWCTIMKDRSTELNGKSFKEPNFSTFLPHIQKLNIGGAETQINVKETSASLFPQDRDDRAFERKAVIAEITDLFTSHFPGQKAEEKKAKVDLLHKHFGASWPVIERRVPLEALQSGYDAMHRELRGTPSKYAEPELDDEIPEPREAEA